MKVTRVPVEQFGVMVKLTAQEAEVLATILRHSFSYIGDDAVDAVVDGLYEELDVLVDDNYDCETDDDGDLNVIYKTTGGK